MVSFVIRPLYRGGSGPWYSLDWRLYGPQSHSELCAEMKGTLPLSAMEHRLPDRPARILATALIAVPVTSLALTLGNKTVHF